MTTTDTPRRLDAYIRVSRRREREGEKFISPKQQEERIRAWAAAMGHEISDAGPNDGAWHEIDQSGGKMDRPMLNEIMERIDSGESDGIVVFTLDRFGRTLIGALQLIERIHDKGALFASVSDSFDITTDNGRLILRIMLSLAQFELDRSRTRWADARNDAVERGWHLSGYRPFGYRRERRVNESGDPYLAGLVVDPVEGPVVTELFRRRAAGESYRNLVQWLNGTGVPTSKGVPVWRVGSVISIFGNAAYLGNASGGRSRKTGKEEVKEGAHTPLTDPVTWRAVQKGSAPVRARKGESPTLAQGVVRCAGCRYVASLQPRAINGGGGRAWSYACTRSKAAVDCPEPISVTAYSSSGRPTVDDVIADLVLERLESGESIGYAAMDDADDLDALEQDWIVANERHMEAVADLESEAKHGKPAWDRRCAVLKAHAEERLELLLQARQRVKMSSSSLGRPVRELVRDWREGRLDLSEKRFVVANMVQAIFMRRVDGGAGGNFTEKRREKDLERLRRCVHIVWADDEPVEVPRQGLRGWLPKPYEFRAA